VTEWFEQWFGEEYLKLYPHRDEEDATAAVEFIAAQTQLRGARLLDLACGPGRHAKLLRAAGSQVVGFDLSMPLLSRARHRTNPPLSVVRGDMRYLPFRPRTFDVVVNMFTSFGYFADDTQHQLVAGEIATVLESGGVMVLDYFNSSSLHASLVEYEERAIGRQRVIIERSFSEDGKFVLKNMHLMDDGRHFMERVRMFTPEELESLFACAGLNVEERFGGYDSGSLTKDSPRVILLVKKP
jgi:SAM-dependent methyltransferase